MKKLTTCDFGIVFQIINSIFSDQINFWIKIIKKEDTKFIMEGDECFNQIPNRHSEFHHLANPLNFPSNEELVRSFV